jgi:surface protein
MFRDCSSLTELDLSSFDTSKVTTMEGIFNNCSSLTELDLSSFDTSNVATMHSMFYNCISLTSLDLTGFSFKDDNVDVGYMFGHDYYSSKEVQTLIKINENGYNFLSGKEETQIAYYDAKYVQLDGVTPWGTSTP